MSKISIVYWSQTGNTAAMAYAIAEGIKEGGKEADIMEAGLGGQSEGGRCNCHRRRRSDVP